MKSKYQLKDSSFYYPNTDIPKNKFDIKDGQIIDDIEQELLIKSKVKVGSVKVLLYHHLQKRYLKN